MSGGKLGRLLLVTSDYHYREGGRICTTSAFMRFVPELLALARRVEVCAPVHPSGEGAGFTIEGDGVGYRPLPPSRTLEQFLRRFPRDGIAIVRTLYGGIRWADFVWINGPHPLLPLAAAVCRTLRVPYALWIRGDILGTVAAKYRGGVGRDRLAGRTAWYLDGAMRLAARGAVVLYTGRELRRYGRGTRHAQAAQSSLVRAEDLAPAPRNAPGSPVRLLWAGQLRPVKGLPCLLEAVRLLLDRGHALRLTLVGGGEQEAEMRALRASLELEGVVELAGYVPPGAELGRYFREADLFVLPSRSEGVPKVLMEAMARALPVVATRVGGVPDVVRAGESGLLVPPDDAVRLADALERLMLDGALYGRLSAGALAYAREHTAAAEVRRIRGGLEAAFPALWGGA